MGCGLSKKKKERLLREAPERELKQFLDSGKHCECILGCKQVSLLTMSYQWMMRSLIGFKIFSVLNVNLGETLFRRTLQDGCVCFDTCG